MVSFVICMWKTPESPQFPFALSQWLFKLLIWVCLCWQQAILCVSAYKWQGEGEGKAVFTQKQVYKRNELLTMSMGAGDMKPWDFFLSSYKSEERRTSMNLAVPIICNIEEWLCFGVYPAVKSLFRSSRKFFFLYCGFNKPTHILIANISASSLCVRYVPRVLCTLFQLILQ